MPIRSIIVQLQLFDLRSISRGRFTKARTRFVNGHLLLHGNDCVFLGDVGDTTSVEEAEANAFSASVLIPADHRADPAATPLNTEGVRRFARSVGIVPGVVMGQLQHMDRIRPENLNRLKRHYEWQDIQTDRLPPKSNMAIRAVLPIADRVFEHLKAQTRRLPRAGNDHHGVVASGETASGSWPKKTKRRACRLQPTESDHRLKHSEEIPILGY